MVSIAPRASWGAKRPDGDTSLPGLAKEVFLHHSVTATLSPSATVAQERAQMRVLERIGYSRFGRYGQGISYNVVIFPSGRAYQGVSFNRRGAHTDGRNSTVRSICFAGNFEANQPTGAAIATAVAIIAAGQAKWWVAGAPIRGHRDIKATACPGKHVYSQLDDIRRDVVVALKPKPTKKPASAKVVLGYGAKGAKVKRLQQGLNAVFPTYRNESSVRRGYRLAVDGSYGPNVRAWVRIFQARAGLKVTGNVDAPTAAKLKSFGINL